MKDKKKVGGASALKSFVEGSKDNKKTPDKKPKKEKY
jgi:hypothetical protein